MIYHGPYHVSMIRVMDLEQQQQYKADMWAWLSACGIDPNRVAEDPGIEVHDGIAVTYEEFLLDRQGNRIVTRIDEDEPVGFWSRWRTVPCVAAPPKIPRRRVVKR